MGDKMRKFHPQIIKPYNASPSWFCRPFCHTPSHLGWGTRCHGLGSCVCESISDSCKKLDEAWLSQQDYTACKALMIIHEYKCKPQIWRNFLSLVSFCPSPASFSWIWRFMAQQPSNTCLQAYWPSVQSCNIPKSSESSLEKVGYKKQIFSGRGEWCRFHEIARNVVHTSTDISGAAMEEFDQSYLSAMIHSYKDLAAFGLPPTSLKQVAIIESIQLQYIASGVLISFRDGMWTSSCHPKNIFHSENWCCTRYSNKTDLFHSIFRRYSILLNEVKSNITAVKHYRMWYTFFGTSGI